MPAVVLPIRLGQKAAEPVNEDFRSLYASVAGAFSREGDASVESSITTIPISRESDLTDLAPSIRARIAQAGPNVIIIDLANSARQVLPPYSIVNGIVQICQAGSEPTPLQYQLIFLVVSRLWSEDPPMAILGPLIETGRASIITDGGEVTGNRPSSFNPSAYATALQRARKTPLWLLKHKLVRRHGHFKRHRSGGHDHCVKYFFDGSHCKTEIAQLLVRELTAHAQHTQVLANATDSIWLLEPVEAAAIKMNLAFAIVNADVPDSSSEVVVADNPVLVVPLCDTGESLRKIIRLLILLNPDCQPRVIAVMSTEGQTIEQGRRVIEVDGKQHVVSYLLKVDQPRFLRGTCRQCRIDIPETLLFNDADTTHYAPHAMWSMILEAGLKAEDDVPDSRPSLGLVPNFPQIIANNGPDLACRMHELLTRMVGNLPRDPIIVCPDERGAKALATALTSLFKYTVIHVPRSAIRNGFAAINDTGNATTDWMIQLTSLRARGDNTELIVFDEFNASGGTREGLKRLADLFELGVRCYFSLFDFNPDHKAHLDTEVHSLYSIDWIHDEIVNSLA